MRKVAVRCAAANDEEDLTGLFDERETKRPRRSEAASSSDAAPKKDAKKEKEFAWMDSEDEDEEDEKAKDQKAKDQKAKDEKAEEDDNEEVTLEKLEAVKSFGRMMVLSESLGKKLKDGALGSSEVAAACRALARSKFFDGDLLEELCKCLPKMLEANKLTAEEATDAIVCLHELNFYNKELFSAVAKSFKTKVSAIAPAVRCAMLQCMEVIGHKQDPDFQQLLQAPPLLPGSPNYKTIRCAFFAKGTCTLGSLCTYAHNMQAPMNLTDASKEDAWRSRSVMLTQVQMYSTGNDAYASAPLL